MNGEELYVLYLDLWWPSKVPPEAKVKDKVSTSVKAGSTPRLMVR